MLIRARSSTAHKRFECEKTTTHIEFVLSSDSEVQIVTQIKETQQNQPMFTIDAFPNWQAETRKC